MDLIEKKSKNNADILIPYFPSFINKTESIR